MKDVTDQQERNIIVKLRHKNLPKDIKFGKTKTPCDDFQSEHSVLQMYIASEFETLHDFTMNKKPSIEMRMNLYTQLAKAIDYIHHCGLVLCYLNPHWIFVIEGEYPNEKQVSHKTVSAKSFDLYKRSSEIVQYFLNCLI